MPRLPHENYIWVGTPADKYNAAMFKRYYKLPKDIVFDVIPYETWIGK